MSTPTSPSQALTTLAPAQTPAQMLDALRGMVEAAGGPDADIVLHVGSQTVRVPARRVAELLARGVDSFEGHVATASGVWAMAYGLAKQGVTLLWPFLPGVLSGFLGLPVTLPKRPRHTDPIPFLARHLIETVMPFAGIAELTLRVDPAGEVAGAHADLFGHRFDLWTAGESADSVVIVEEGK